MQTAKIGVWEQFPRCFCLKWAQTPQCTLASVSSLRVRIWNFSFETNTRSGFPFSLSIQSKVTTISNSGKTPLCPTAHKNANRAGFRVGVGNGSSRKNTCKMEEGVMCCRRGWTATSSKDGKTWHPSRNSCRGGIQFVILICVSLYSRAKCFSSPFEMWRWVFHSFRAIHWCKLALV